MTGQPEFFGALLDPARPCPAGLTAWNGSNPAARFAVYRNNVTVSLVDALADTFAVTQELVGVDFFRAMALPYVRAQPPRSRVLAFYGETFPDFIGRFPPAASVPYLADVANLEWLRVRAYHAADAAADPVETLARALMDLETLPDRRIGLHPSVGLVRSRYAVISLWAAHQGIADISTVDPDVPENALVVRPDLEVEVIGVHAATAAFIAHLLQGVALGAAADQAAAAHPQFDLTGTLGLLIRRRAIVSLQSTTGAPP